MILIDAHFERRATGSPSSFPTTPGRYGFLTVCLLPTNDGQKLVIGTRTSNFLVMSSIRLDRQSVNIGPATTHFRPTASTKIFLDCLSIELVKLLLTQRSIAPNSSHHYTNSNKYGANSTACQHIPCAVRHPPWLRL